MLTVLNQFVLVFELQINKCFFLYTFYLQMYRHFGTFTVVITAFASLCEA